MKNVNSIILTSNMKKSRTKADKADDEIASAIKESVEAGKKKKRPDVAAKKKETLNNSETVVKCCLLKHLHGEQESKIKIVNTISSIVEKYSKRCDLASLALMGIIKEIYSSVDDLQNFQVPFSLFTQTFMRQLLIGTDDSRKTEPLVQAFYERSPELLEGDKTLAGSRNVWSAGATKFLTSFKNSLKTNLVRRIRKFASEHANARYPDNQQANQYAKRFGNLIIWGAHLHPCKDASGNDIPEILTEEDQSMASLHRSILGLDLSTPVMQNAYHLEDARYTNEEDNVKLGRILNYFVYLLREMEKHNFPLFSICPRYSLRCHYVTIDTWSLYGVMKASGLTACKNEIAFNKLGKEHWESFLRFDMLKVSDKKKFTGTIETDGVGLCIHFKNPKPDAGEAISNEIRKHDPSKEIVLGCDPGRTNIFTFVQEMPENKYKTYTLTRKHYYTSSGILDSNKQDIVWRKPLKDTHDIVSKLSPKGINLAKHSEYVAMWMKVRSTLWEELSKKRWSRQRLRLYAGKRKTMDRFFNKLQRSCNKADKSKTIVIAYGAGGFKASAKREQSVPVKWAKAMCAKRFRVHLVDEYRSSRVHSEDDMILKAVWSEGKGKSVRGLLWYESTIPGESKFVDRDKNAAINIRRCYMSECHIGTRPPSMCRKACQGAPLPRNAPVGCVIN